ncbi:MAG: DUF418 domain-containing protein [bacterium]|nr:DUF418 domain-containing protein [bacterium]
MNKESEYGARITGYDFARALAVIGMVLVNFKIVLGAEKNGPDWLIWFAGLFSGRAAATFVILAGVGLTLLSRKAVREGDSAARTQIRIQLWKRSLFLMVVGLIYTPLWPADILHFYAIYIAIGALMITASGKRLISLAFVFMFGFLILLVFFNYESNWNWETLSYENFWTLAGMFKHLFFNGFHPVIPWTFFLLLGMWLGRQDLLDKKRRTKILITSVVIASVTEFLSWWGIRAASPETWQMPLEEIKAIIGTGPMPPMPQYLVAAAATAVTVILLSIIITEKFKESQWVNYFISAGQLALTLYVAHVVIGMLPLFVLGLEKNRSLAFVFLYTFAFCFLSIVCAYHWRKKFKRGPLEWGMRKITG